MSISKVLTYKLANYLLQDGDGVSGHRNGVEGLIIKDGVEDLIFVVSTEGRLPQQHFVCQDAKCPPVDGTAVTLLE